MEVNICKPPNSSARMFVRANHQIRILIVFFSPKMQIQLVGSEAFQPFTGSSCIQLVLCSMIVYEQFDWFHRAY